MIPGAQYAGRNRCSFVVWAPKVARVQLQLMGGSPHTEDLALKDGYWQADLEDVAPGTRYVYRLGEGRERPDPASHFQPEGVHGPSEVVDHAAFQWTDAGWESVPLEDMVIYELHVGTFTPERTFAAVIPRLPHLKKLGVTALEIMPVAQFPGDRNWGYDGVYPYAVQNSYGGPQGLKALVDAAHREGMSAILDVVYNHLGPEGNYLWDFGPYFTDRHTTPWGQAINLDQADSHHVRRFFIENALHWLRDYHFDALRLDALHAIFDMSAKHFLQELAEQVAKFSRHSGRKCYLIGESDLNDVRLIKSRRSGGYGLDAQWSDDFHHCLHTLLTGESKGYYEDFGKITQLAKAFKEGFVYSWQYSRHRRRFHGSNSRSRPARQFVVCAQNHDQVGNRMRGERLSQLVDFESTKLAAGVLLLAPYVPLLFMGEEYGETSPFQYFVSHTDEQLVEAVRTGRAREFESFQWDQECPDPQAVETFERSTLNWQARNEGSHHLLLAFYRRLLALRRSIPHVVSKKHVSVGCLPEKRVLTWHRVSTDGQMQSVMNFSDERQQFTLGAPQAVWSKILDSAGNEWDGPGATLPNRVHGRQEVDMPAHSIAVYRTERREVLREQVQAEAAESVAQEISDAYPQHNIQASV